MAKSRRARELLQAGKGEEAIPVCRELVRAMPHNPGLVMNLGLALYLAGHKREAASEFEKVLKLDPNHLQALLYLGAARVDLGEPAKALDPLRKVLKSQPENMDAHIVLGESLLSVGALEEAAGQFRGPAQSVPDNPRVWYGLGLCYERLAQQSFDALAPGSAYWFALVAEARLKLTQYNSAFYFYRQALERMPSLRGVHAGLAEVYRKANHPDWAAAEEEKERALPSPDCTAKKLECDFRAGNFLQVVAGSQGDKSDEALYWRTSAFNRLALESFARLGQLPPSAEMHELLARMESERRQYVESAKEWEKALELSPANPSLKEGLAIALFRSGDLPRARALFEELLKREPDSAVLNYMLGDTLLNSQKPQEAVPLLRKALVLEPGLLGAQASLARAYLAIGDAEKAVPHLKAALSIDEDGSLHYQLARAYQARGEQALAREMLKKYRELHATQEAENKAVEKEVEITPP
ncbi:MAG: tetratricopeptide repeat protein [Terriglobia bacterium]